MSFKRIDQRVTIRHKVQQTLREAILNGDLEPGSKLIESRLATEFGVSRAPVREAISALVEEGFVEAVPFDGYFVQSFTAQDLKDLYEMRKGLECLAFEIVWPKRNVAFFSELDRRNNILKEAIISENRPKAIKAELAVHATVYEYANNKLLLSAWKTLSGRLQVYWVIHQQIHHRRGAVYTGHDRYIELAKGDNLQEMFSEIAEHVTRGMSDVNSEIEQQQFISSDESLRG